MILPKPTDVIHKMWMYRLVSAIADNPLLVKLLRFKGGTCAAMRGILPRFSVDLDFDLIAPEAVKQVKSGFEIIIKKLGLEIDDSSQVAPQYFLKYKNKPGERNTIKIDVAFPPPKNNEYEPVRLTEIDRIIYCHTIPTMVANKLITIAERYKRNGSLAGRDLYDLHIFLMRGYPFKHEIIKERTGKSAPVFLKFLHSFIKRNFTQTIIDQDLNHLLSVSDFHKIRKTLRQEVLLLLRTLLAQ